MPYFVINARFPNLNSMNISSKRDSTKRRHKILIDKFDKFMQPNEHGLRPDLDAVYKKLEYEIGYSERYIKRVLKYA